MGFHMFTDDNFNMEVFLSWNRNQKQYNFSKIVVIII